MLECLRCQWFTDYTSSALSCLSTSPVTTLYSHRPLEKGREQGWRPVSGGSGCCSLMCLLQTRYNTVCVCVKGIAVYVHVFFLQNGTLMDGLLLWKSNLDKHFAGVEDCMICFSVIHGSLYSLPKMTCRTCKKKFHSACLVRVNT